MNLVAKKIIAIDFDGTIVEDRYPGIGEPLIFAIDTIKRLKQDGHKLILWTYRTGKELDAAVDFCKQQGIEFHAVNRGVLESDESETVHPRKIHADLFIDDRNIGGFPGWGKIYQMLTNEPAPKPPEKKRGLFSRR
jgi:hydroxymethylpyrimidine pyrophosphatase-like HAD family hydrolase